LTLNLSDLCTHWFLLIPFIVCSEGGREKKGHQWLFASENLILAKYQPFSRDFSARFEANELSWNHFFFFFISVCSDHKIKENEIFSSFHEGGIHIDEGLIKSKLRICNVIYFFWTLAFILDVMKLTVWYIYIWIWFI
jgi:hypothetical protein